MYKNLRELAKALQNDLPLMNNRTKGEQEDLIGEIVTIEDYDFMKGENGAYVVFTVKEYPEQFFFGGSVLTEQLQKVEEAEMHDQVISEGLPMLLTKKQSKETKRNYTAVKFYPEG